VRLIRDSGQNCGGETAQPEVTCATARASIEGQAQYEGGTSTNVATPIFVLIELHPRLLHAVWVTPFKPGRLHRVLTDAPVGADGRPPEKLHRYDVGDPLEVL
jgi:hypothetical protein